MKSYKRILQVRKFSKTERHFEHSDKHTTGTHTAVRPLNWYRVLTLSNEVVSEPNLRSKFQVPSKNTPAKRRTLLEKTDLNPGLKLSYGFICAPPCGLKWRVNCTCKKVKVKWSRYRPGVAQRVGTGIALLFHDRGTRKGWVVSSAPRPHFTPGARPGTHFTGGWVGPRAGLDGRKISSPPGFDTGKVYL